MNTANKITDAKMRILNVTDAIAFGKASKQDLRDYQTHLNEARVSLRSENVEEADVAGTIAALFTQISIAALAA